MPADERADPAKLRAEAPPPPEPVDGMAREGYDVAADAVEADIVVRVEGEHALEIVEIAPEQAAQARRGGVREPARLRGGRVQRERDRDVTEMTKHTREACSLHARTARSE